MNTAAQTLAPPRPAHLLPLAAVAALLAAVLLAFTVGRYPIAPGDVLAVLWAKATGGSHSLPGVVETVVLQVRGPRVLAAVLVGAALAAAGAAYQGMFRNPLVSPDILGVSSGAALGASLGIFFSLSALAIQGLAFAGGMGAVAAVWFVGSRVRGHEPILALILTGVVVGTLLGALLSLVKYLADPYSQLPAITFWLLGSLASVNPRDLLWLALLVTAGLVPLTLLRWRMNLLTLPDEEARALGVATGRLRLTVVASATLMTAAAVSVSGIIGWIGLLIPHAARHFTGPDFGRLLPVAMALGAAFLLLVDTLARTVAEIELPPGVLTALLGAPFFIWLLARGRRDWA